MIEVHAGIVAFVIGFFVVIWPLSVFVCIMLSQWVHREIFKLPMSVNTLAFIMVISIAFGPVSLAAMVLATIMITKTSEAK